MNQRRVDSEALRLPIVPGSLVVRLVLIGDQAQVVRRDEAVLPDLHGLDEALPRLLQSVAPVLLDTFANQVVEALERQHVAFQRLLKLTGGDPGEGSRPSPFCVLGPAGLRIQGRKNVPENPVETAVRAFEQEMHQCPGGRVEDLDTGLRGAAVLSEQLVEGETGR